MTVFLEISGGLHFCYLTWLGLFLVCFETGSCGVALDWPRTPYIGHPDLQLEISLP
jgi:hypothetical protein